jgi:pimeloyl-ACP methyl ester carboxylesterase
VVQARALERGRVRRSPVPSRPARGARRLLSALVYLHGFASGPGSTKAQFFRARLADLGIELAVPELAPDFTHQTVSGMLGVVEPMLDAGTVLLGSSLGGYLAALAASRRADRVRGLVLFAPAFGFATRWEARLGPEGVRQWRERGTIPAMHYGTGREEPLAFDLIADARRHAGTPDPPCPALVFAGSRDETVPLAGVAAFAARRPAERELVVLDAGHEMTEVLEPMWERTAAFLRRVGAIG